MAKISVAVLAEGVTAKAPSGTELPTVLCTPGSLHPFLLHTSTCIRISFKEYSRCYSCGASGAVGRHAARLCSGTDPVV